jgi:hypothetical protein
MTLLLYFSFRSNRSKATFRHMPINGQNGRRQRPSVTELQYLMVVMIVTFFEISHRGIVMAHGLRCFVASLRNSHSFTQKESIYVLRYSR